MGASVHIEAVLWDMDGLLLDTERLSREAWRAAVQEKGFPFPDDIFLRLIGHNHPTCVNILVDHYGSEFPHDEITKLRKRYWQDLIDTRGITLKEGAREVLEYLNSRAVPCALATSTHSSVAEQNLHLVGLFDYFSVRVGGESTEKGKPNPDIFLKTAEQLGKDPALCLVLEDSCPGVQAAVRAGMRVIMVPDLVEPSEEVRKSAYKIFPSLSDLSDFFKCSSEICFYSKRSGYESA